MPNQFIISKIKMKEEKELKQEFLNILKATLAENIVKTEATDAVIIENTIVNCIKEVSKKLEEQLILTQKESEKETNKQIVRDHFESGLSNKIKEAIEGKVYLNSRLDSKITGENQTEIRRKVTEFSDKYFILEIPLNE